MDFVFPGLSTCIYLCVLCQNALLDTLKFLYYFSVFTITSLIFTYIKL